jgi:hypothetical protein
MTDKVKICTHWDPATGHCKLAHPRRNGYKWAIGRCNTPYLTRGHGIAGHGCKDLKVEK